MGVLVMQLEIVYGLISCLLCTKIYNVGRDDL